MIFLGSKLFGIIVNSKFGFVSKYVDHKFQVPELTTQDFYSNKKKNKME